MVTKDQFMDSLDALTCALCLEPYSSDHVRIQLPCNHIFGDYCISNVAESESPNNNRCPLCRKVLFEQEDFDENGDPISDDEERELDGFSDEDGLDEEELMARDDELLVEADETVAALAMDDEMDVDLPMPEGYETMDGEETVASLAMPEEHQVAAVEQNNARAPQTELMVPANGEAGNNAGTESNISSDGDFNPVPELDESSDEEDADVSSDDEFTSVSESTDDGGELMPASSSQDETDSGPDADSEDSVDSEDSGDSVSNVAEKYTIQEKDADVEMQDVEDECTEAVDSGSEYGPSSDGDVDTDD